MLNGIVDRGNGGANARVVLDFIVFDGDVEIDSNKNSLAFEIKITDGEPGHCRFPIANCRLKTTQITTYSEKRKNL